MARRYIRAQRQYPLQRPISNINGKCPKCFGTGLYIERIGNGGIDIACFYCGYRQSEVEKEVCYASATA